jgi:hypothetical protein
MVMPTFFLDFQYIYIIKLNEFVVKSGRSRPTFFFPLRISIIISKLNELRDLPHLTLPLALTLAVRNDPGLGPAPAPAHGPPGHAPDPSKNKILDSA